MKVLTPECVFTYDGSLDGFFTVVFHAFHDRTEPSAIIPRGANTQIPLGSIIDVDTSVSKATRVRKGVVDRSDNRNVRLLHVAFLTGMPETNMLLWRYLKKLFQHPPGYFFRNMLDEDVYALVQTARRVRKEVHRFQGFVRFQKTKDQIYAAAIDPDNDVVKLLAPHFRARFPDRKWLIYDTRRKYGIYFDAEKLSQVELKGEAFDLTTGHIQQNARAMDEDYYRTLWQHYYEAINIMERKNHRQMRASMPKRYWKYLPEKGANWQTG